MDFIRIYFNRLKNNPPPLEKAQKYMALARYSYFLSCLVLGIYVLKSYKQKQEKDAKELGDTSAAHRRLREKGVERGTIYTFNSNGGLLREEFDREEYLRELEKRTIEKADEAKRIALLEGQELVGETNDSSQ